MPIEQLTNYFFTQGILGIINIVLAIVIVLQYRTSRKDSKESALTVAALQEKRVSDSNIYSEKFITTAQQLLNQNKEQMTLIQANQKGLETVASILQNMKG